jgi:hypothetical protein
LVPIYKRKGDAKAWDSYRGISILSTWYKILSRLLALRLEKYCERGKLRSVSQCGFRKFLRSTTAAFVLYHSIVATCSSKEKGGRSGALFVCFIDFSKAFDSVSKNLLWSRLEQLGINGRMLNIIKELYKDTRFQVKVNSKISKGFVVTLSGVRQGCPLSPLLFGVFIEQLHHFLQKRCADIKVIIVDEEGLWELLFADDIALLAYSAHDLKRLCSALKDFCDMLHMEVNQTKTEIVVFRSPRSKDTKLQEIEYNGGVFLRKPNFRYLGLEFNELNWLAFAPQRLAESAEKAMYSVLAKCEGLHITCIQTKINMFMTFAASIANYGCQVWAVNFLNLDNEYCVFDNPFQRVVFTYLRLISKVRRTVSRWVLLKEFGVHTSQMFWAKLCARFWNRNLGVKAVALPKAILKKDK